jgi:phosphoribosylformylglycinamidine synthase
MPQILRLRGRSALSGFRLARLRDAFRDAAGSAVPAIALDATYLHFVCCSGPLDAAARDRLERILTYGPADAPSAASGSALLVVPRIGTISPWSSKATEIARCCGLGAVMRIERGVEFRVGHADGRALDAIARARLLPLLHDRMTETVLEDAAEADRLFQRFEPQPLATIDVAGGGREALVEANRAMGLALSPDEIDYLVGSFRRMRRNPTDVELMMFAQANSEHCRHKIFNADWVIDGSEQERSLFAMIRNTHALAPQGTVVAYSDNSAVMEGARVARFVAGEDGVYRSVEDDTHILMKVETHNHPTAISPYAGAATGAGGEIRDEGATGRGAKPKAGLTGFTVSHLRIPGFEQPWERAFDPGRPERIASALAIMLEGPIGGAAFNNEFGRPNLAGYFRTFEQQVAGEARGYHKPIMLAGGIGNIAARHAQKHELPVGALIIQLGGPGMLIGMGGGAASSMGSGSNTADLDFDSVQRGNAEIERRAQEVIDRCWALGDANPILSIHDVGAGGLSNALPELVHQSGRGARFDLRAVPSEEPGMSPMQVWCNEAQERYVLAIAPDRRDLFRRMCERERAPFAVVGEATGDGHLRVDDAVFGNRPVDMDLGVLLGKPPKMLRDVERVTRSLPPLDRSGIDLRDAVTRVLRFPAVADKTFLVTIGDRTVGGLCTRDPMVGPWQVPVADAAVTTMGFRTNVGEAFAIGERTPLALIDSAAAARMAVGEAITNIASAPIGAIGAIKLSANWMAPAGHPGEDAALYAAVQAVGMELCPALGVSIPVGKDSMSMKTAWRDGEAERSVTAPVSLIVSAFARVTDARRALTPQLRTDRGDTVLVLIDLAAGRMRLGGSALAQVFNQLGNDCPDVDDPALVRGFVAALQEGIARGLILAYHDRSDGGLLATIAEMMFAGRTGVTLDLTSYGSDDPLAALFNEELGAVLQVRTDDVPALRALFDAAGLGAAWHVTGRPAAGDALMVRAAGTECLRIARIELRRAWSETTHRLQRLRDHPDAARDEFERNLDPADAGLHAHLTFDPDDDVAAPYVNRGARPRMAVLREQGVNGHVEMAAAFDRAGFESVDVHMSDVIAGRRDLAGFKGVVACGGFSYGDVLGAGEGWAKSILFNDRACAVFEAFFARPDSFALGVCNGCQMMANLTDIIPGTAHWPRFVRNRSEQFEARYVLVEVTPSPSLFFDGMAGSRIPVPTAHGEGYAEFRSDAQLAAARPLVTLRFVDHQGGAATRYPYNPNGSPDGITGLTTADGRFSILMPHPERVFRSVQCSWRPDTWGEDGAWLRMFRNARAWLG